MATELQFSKGQKTCSWLQTLLEPLFFGIEIHSKVYKIRKSNTKEKTYMCKFISTDYPAEQNAHFWEKKHTKNEKKEEG